MSSRDGSTAVGQDLDVDLRIDRPHAARMYDYMIGGKTNFPADRKAAEDAIRANPTLTVATLSNRSFLRRCVYRLAADHGVRQFLDIGTGIPTPPNTHEIAQAVDSRSRVVYVDNDPIVLAHARALMTSSREGATSYIDADLREPAWLQQLGGGDGPAARLQAETGKGVEHDGSEVVEVAQDEGEDTDIECLTDQPDDDVLVRRQGPEQPGEHDVQYDEHAGEPAHLTLQQAKAAIDVLREDAEEAVDDAGAAHGSMLVWRSGLGTPGRIDDRDFRIQRCDALPRVSSSGGLRNSEGTRSAAR
jgi:hypothetical protein